MSLAAAVEIGQSLVSSAVWHEDRCNWIGPARRDPLDGSVSAYESLRPDLYAGSAGIAWFLAQLYASTGQKEFRRTAHGAIRHSLFASGRMERVSRLSFYVGSVGIAFTAVELARRLGVEELERDARACLRDAIGAGVRGSPFDLVTGTAGTMAALPILSRRLGDEQLLDLAIALADRTLERAQSSRAGISWPSSDEPRQRNLTGFSHGAAGVGYGLLELFVATGCERFRGAAASAFEYERQLFDSELENWPDFRGMTRAARTKPASRFLKYWCHGAPGIALARLRAWELLRDDACLADARAAIRTTRSAVTSALESERGGYALCHGLAGNAEILLESIDSPAFAPDGLCDLVAESARHAATRAQSRQAGSPSLFLGLAGIGYLNLRLHDRRLPSLLTLRSGQFV
jgi:lantibiotic modifying enzyme